MSETTTLTEMPVPKYTIGQEVWFPSIERTTRQLPCPDCLGSQKWTVTTPAGTLLTCKCLRCSGYYSDLTTPAHQRLPSLKIEDWVPAVRSLTIGSIQVDTAAHWYEKVRYMCRETGVGSGSVYDESNLFISREEAEIVANLKAADKVAAAQSSPQMLQSREVSKLTVQPAFLTADWNAVYTAWDYARWHEESVTSVIDDKEMPFSNKAEIVEYLETRQSELARYEFITPHPLKALVEAARHSVDPVICKVIADIDAKFPLAKIQAPCP